MTDDAASRRVQLQDLDGRVSSALICDVLDARGLRTQCLDPAIVPLRTGDVLLGYAFPVRIEVVDSIPEVPYRGLLAAIDAIGPGEVFVAATGGQASVAVWGELVGTACAQRGAVGAVCDGLARDSATLRTRDFPVFCRGTVPYDSNGRSEVTAHGVTVDVGEVRVNPGDLVVADDDGVVIVPSTICVEVLAAAQEKGQNESLFRQAVRDGMRATDAFAKFGVL